MISTYSTATRTEGGDGLARGKDVNDTAVVGEASTAIRRGGGTNSASTWLRSGGGVLGITAVVSGGDGKEDTVADHVGGRVVEGG